MRPAGGCGGGGAISRSRAISYAHAVGLRAGDLPGARLLEPGRVPRASGGPSWKLATCLGYPADARRTIVLSPLLALGPWYARSLLFVPAQGAAAPSAPRASRAAACVADVAKRLTGGLEHAYLTASLLAGPVAGPPGSAVFRFRLSGQRTSYSYKHPGGESSGEMDGPGPAGLPRGARVRHWRFTLYADLAVIPTPAPGVWIGLYAGNGPKPFPAARLRNLLGTLSSRAAAHEL